MKRVTEYPILLEKLLKHTRYINATSNNEPNQQSLDDNNELMQDHPDRQNLEEALYIAKRLCDQVKLVLPLSFR